MAFFYPPTPSSGSGASYTASLVPTPSSIYSTFPLAPLVAGLALREGDGGGTVPLLQVLHQWAAAAGAPPLPPTAAAAAPSPSPNRIALEAAEATRLEEEGRLAALLPAAPLAVQAEAEALRRAFVQRTNTMHHQAQAFLARRVALYQPLLQATEGAGAAQQQQPAADACLGLSLYARVDAALTAIARGHTEQMRALRLRCEAASGPTHPAAAVASSPTPTALLMMPPPPPPAPMAAAIEAEHTASQPTQGTDAETQGTQQRPLTAASSSSKRRRKGAAGEAGAEAEVGPGEEEAAAAAAGAAAAAKPKKKKAGGGGTAVAASQAAKDVLTGWLARHWTDPYPEEAELEALATETGLPADQVRTWFMNARGRTWKPRNQRAYHEAIAQDSPKPLLQLLAAVPASDGCKRMLQRLQREAKAGMKPKPEQEEPPAATAAVVAEPEPEPAKPAAKPVPLLEQPLIIWEEGAKRRAKAKALSRFAQGKGGGGGCSGM